MKKPNFVKLYIYQFQSEKILIDTIEAEDFDNFIIVSLDTNQISQQEQIENIQRNAAECFPNKKLLIVDKNLDIAFYGFKEEVELELPSGS